VAGVTFVVELDVALLEHPARTMPTPATMAIRLIFIISSVRRPGIDQCQHLSTLVNARLVRRDAKDPRPKPGAIAS